MLSYRCQNLPMIFLAEYSREGNEGSGKLTNFYKVLGETK